MTRLWREEAIVSSRNFQEKEFLCENVFPSGRQALTYCLKHAGISRDDRVAIPEWSSHCVISAVGKVATPIPLQEVLQNGIEVSTVLLYDQWGWPTSSLESVGIIVENTKCRVLIHDRVDSIPVSLNGDVSRFDVLHLNYKIVKTIYSLFSLSKTLGLCGGGLVFCNGENLTFNKSSADNFNEVQQLGKLKNKNDYLQSFFKSEIPVMPIELVEWFKLNDLPQALEVEKENRRINLNKVANSKLVASWPVWMISALKQGITPGIVPLLRGTSKNKLDETQSEIWIKYKIETSVYHFNWSNNSLDPVYEKCLAFPVHGMVTNIDDVIITLQAKVR